MVQVQADRQAGLSDGGLYQLDQIGMVSIGPSALGDLEDQGGVDLFGRLDVYKRQAFAFWTYLRYNNMKAASRP